MLAEAAHQFQRASEPHQILDTDDDFIEHTIVDRPPAEPPAPAAPRSSAPAEAPSQAPEATGRASSLPSAPPVSAPAPRPPSQPAQPAGPETHHATRVAVRKGTGGMLLVRPLRGEESPAAGEQAALLVPLEPNLRLG